MSSNVGLPTPRGSGTSGYVQKNWAFLKPRNVGYGAPYPHVAGSSSLSSSGAGGGGGRDHFKQRQPDRRIREHDRRRAIELKVLEERERLEEENERVEALLGRDLGDGEGEGEGDAGRRRVLSEEEIEERCEALRWRLVRELELELEGDKEEEEWGSWGKATTSTARTAGADFRRRGRRPDESSDNGLKPTQHHRERRQFKPYQVHELAEAKIEESERLRKALGIREDWENTDRSAYASRRERKAD